jgi:hypothetical protein
MRKINNRSNFSRHRTFRLIARISSLLVIAGTLLYVIKEISGFHPLESGTIHPPLDDYKDFTDTLPP